MRNAISDSDRLSIRGDVWFRLVFSLALLLLGAVALLAIFKLKPREEKAPPSGKPVVNVTVETVTAVPELADTLELPAVVEPNYVMYVSAEVAGRIEKIVREEGMPCDKGDLLMTLNTDLLQAAYDRAKAQAEQDAAQSERIEKLHAGGAVTKQELERATAALGVSRAALAAAGAELERASIGAPNSGILNDLMVEEGEYVQAGTPVAEIVDVATVKVVVQVPEKDIPFVEIGDETPVMAQVGGEKREIAGAVSFIVEVADPDTRTTRVEVAVDNRDGLLRSGEIVRARLTRRVIPNAVMVPLLAVIPLEKGKAVYVVENDTAQRREVSLGIIRGTRIQILNGLRPGDRLIVAGHRFVGPGQAVRMIEDGDAGPADSLSSPEDSQPEDAAR